MEDYKKIALLLGETLISKAPETKEEVKKMLPELRENEDEKIRKNIINYLSLYKDSIGEEFKSWIAWLEAQVKKKPVNTDYISGIRKELLSIEDNAENINGLTENQWVSIRAAHRLLGECIDKEQNPVNKVESKFKIEEKKWYVCTQTYVLRGKIVVIKGQTYQAEKDNVIKGEDGCLFIDRHDGKASDYFRSWTIDDAKNGNVLCYGNEISLYKHDIKNCTKQETTFGGFVYYCCYDGKRFVVDSLYSLTEQDKMDIHPATKEQRDQLEKAMADAGYRWNADEKKLEKIEQKTAEDRYMEGYLNGVNDASKTLKSAGWSEEDESRRLSTIEDLENVYEDTYNRHFSEFTSMDNRNAILKGIKENIDWLKSLKYRVQPQPKQEWNKHDETLLNCCLGAINTTDYFDKDNKDEMDNWLISLKERVQPQPKQEWSEEEQQIIKDAASFILANINTVETKEEEERLEELADKLQDLRPQNTWKPSEEYKEAVQLIYDEKLIPFKDGNQWCFLLGYNIQEGVCGFGDSILEAALEFYKEYTTTRECIGELSRPQSYFSLWKPSDEQMEALEHFIVYHNGSTNYAKDLEELRLQLKKLMEE